MFALVLSILLGLLLQTNAQSISMTATVSVTGTITNTPTVSVTATGSNTVSVTSTISSTVTSTVTVSATNTGTVTRSVSPSSTWTQTGSQTMTPSTTKSAPRTPTPTTTVSAAPKPIGLTNKCPGHATTICPAWSDPTGFNTETIVLYRLAGSGALFTFVPVFFPNMSTAISGLYPSTSYEVALLGFAGFFGAFGSTSAQTASVIMTTGAPTPKMLFSQDINNVKCNTSRNSNTNRNNIICTWSKAPTAPIAIQLRCKCTSSFREPVRIRKNYNSTQAAALTSATFQINRDSAVCNVHIKAFYAGFKNRRRPGHNYNINVIVGV